MDVYTLADWPHVRVTVRERVLRGDVGILPTDTIYGLSGNALDPGVVARVLRIKRRRRPVSIVPHALHWARLLVDDCAASSFFDTMARYAGAFTTLWPHQGGRAPLPRALCSSGLVAFRQPQGLISALAADAARPLLTTSVNITQRPFMSTLDDLDPAIARQVDFIVYAGPLLGPPSTLVYIAESERHVVRT